MKVVILRGYKSEPAATAVESALAMFSEMMRMRPACAGNPDAAIAIDLKKSILCVLQICLPRQRLPIAILVRPRLLV